MRPCADRSNDPNDWFISKDGKQYQDDDLLTAEQVVELQAEVDSLGLVGDEKVDAIDRAVDRAEVDAKKVALQRRRHAREKCHTECYFRTQCLGQALEGDQQHGTWGGYYEEELRQIRLEISRRKRSRRANINE